MSEKTAVSARGLRTFLSLYGPKILKVLIPVGVMGLVYWEGKQEIARMNPAIALHLVEKLKAWKMVLLGLLGLASVLMMSGYDLLFARIQAKEGTKLPLYRVMRISWVANTFNNVVGFAGFTGAGLRLLLYKKAGASVPGLVRYLVFLSFSMMTGLSVMSWLYLAGLFPVADLFADHGWLKLAMWGMALYLPVYMVVFGTPFGFHRWAKQEGKPDIKLSLLALGASLLEWLSAGLMLMAAAAAAGLHVPAAVLLGIFTVSAAAGIFSMAPGGLGAMDLLLLVALNTYGANPDRALAALVLFRIFYYLLPWTIGLFLAASEWMPSRDKLAVATQGLWDKSLTRWQRFWSWPGQSILLGDVGIWALSALVLVSGGVLLLSAATPGTIGRMIWLHHFITPLTMKLSQQITVLVGFILIVLSRGIYLKLKRAYRLSVILLGAGALFSILKGFDYEEAILLSAVAVLLYISRERFYRKHAAFQKINILFWLAITLVVAVGYYIVGDWTRPVPYHWINPKRAQSLFILRQKGLIRSGIVGLAGTWLFFSVWYWLRPHGPAASRPSEEDIARLHTLLEKYPGNALTHLLHLEDKSFFWSKDKEVLLPYARSRSTLVVLGDPIGNPDKFKQAVREFRSYADEWVLTPVFYQISTQWMPLYHEFGFRFFKLGEESFVDVQSFQLTGRSRADLRAVRNRFEREGYTFMVMDPPFSEEWMDELKRISDLWLSDRKEKGFSLGWFDPDYLNLAPVAVVRASDGQVVAFASVMPAYDNGRTASVDLMRFAPDAGNGVMDYMFLQLFEWAKSNGFQRFNLGMAPLSSVGEVPYALREERMANLVFLHANYWYKFKGIRRFKEKFGPDWETRYLAYPQGGALVRIMFHAALLVGRTVKLKSQPK
jgi:phosphatidylglycerol lysyltransferase